MSSAHLSTSDPLSENRIQHYENFPVASWLCPPHLRPAIVAIYNFARTADDIADEGSATAQERLDDLATYRADLYAAQLADTNVKTLSNQWESVFVPLQSAIAQFNLPVPLLNNLLSAFEQDIRKTRDHEGYVNEAELLDYCSRSANPVGRLLLHLYGIHDADALRMSDHICTALQLINFWQDLSQDIPRGRFYLPLESCAEFGVSKTDLLNLKQTPNTTNLIASQAMNTLATIQKGMQLVHILPGRAGWELRFVIQGGLRILDKIKDLNYAMLENRPKLNKFDFVVIAWRALWM
ncbi:MAG: squalene synthase HpnC [Polaromonas sp.]|jgi:squalene synthase HpnC|nr:squalene synthase HpnC [Polaromonas sp.]MBP6088630.1 squalene synthase HpnC [Polaromonas sp.]MBP6142018.1 squalene synthase HpnC [Polaromonas sp.]MBP6155939.1 squalene synthase HpnC [Polaromonas sp.]MBP7115056.1 squalene synthase HpnC [Polaromonas sp.]